MKKYIDELKARIESLFFDVVATQRQAYINDGLDMALSEIDNTPIADVVEVVRCRDCKYYRRYEPPIEDFDGCCNVNEIECDREFYCSYGERKEK